MVWFSEKLVQFYFNYFSGEQRALSLGSNRAKGISQ
jgi:hypothetical protein